MNKTPESHKPWQLNRPYDTWNQCADRSAWISAQGWKATAQQYPDRKLQNTSEPSRKPSRQTVSYPKFQSSARHPQWSRRPLQSPQLAAPSMICLHPNWTKIIINIHPFVCTHLALAIESGGWGGCDSESNSSTPQKSPASPSTTSRVSKMQVGWWGWAIVLLAMLHTTIDSTQPR